MAGKRIRHNLLTYPRQEPFVMNQAYNVNREGTDALESISVALWGARRPEFMASP
jgi:hypothetical protein